MWAQQASGSWTGSSVWIWPWWWRSSNKQGQLLLEKRTWWQLKWHTIAFHCCLLVPCPANKHLMSSSLGLHMNNWSKCTKKMVSHAYHLRKENNENCFYAWRSIIASTLQTCRLVTVYSFSIVLVFHTTVININDSKFCLCSLLINHKINPLKMDE